jgi:hypothetical protein
MTDLSYYKQIAQSNAADFQQSRNDLQPTGSSPQEGGGTAETPGSLSQDQLTSTQLRVGDSATTVQNTTTSTPQTSSSDMASSWTWILPLLVILAVGLWLLLRRRPSMATEALAAEPTRKKVESPDLIEAKNKAAKKKAKPVTKKATAKRKTRK